ncbi:MAG TPA: DUF2905 domain-containing protein [Candidatus Limnocylindrales bacterium]|nr:DUF2905 domain-containing protein [Candidatus Limnocylindrales bacterium]
MSGVPRMLILAGVALVVVGLAWPLVAKLGLGRLPGDIVVERESFRFYFPITTMIVINVVLWLLLRFFGR